MSRRERVPSSDVPAGQVIHPRPPVEPRGWIGDPLTPLHSAQERANIRLEVLRLAHRPDVPTEQVIERVERLVAFVLGEQPADKP